MQQQKPMQNKCLFTLHAYLLVLNWYYQAYCFFNHVYNPRFKWKQTNKILKLFSRLAGGAYHAAGGLVLDDERRGRGVVDQLGDGYQLGGEEGGSEEGEGAAEEEDGGGQEGKRFFFSLFFTFFNGWKF